MLAAYVSSIDPENPLAGLLVGECPEPVARDGWSMVTAKAASLNHHDLWTLRGVGIREEELPLILGGDAAGIDENGNEVVVHSVVSSPGWPGEETLGPQPSPLSEVYDGTLAEKLLIPTRNLVPKPASLSWEEPACLPTAWLTAYRMLFIKAHLQPGMTVLMQGAAGGVYTAAIALCKAAGVLVWVGVAVKSKRQPPWGSELMRCSIQWGGCLRKSTLSLITSAKRHGDTR